ncbi:hypothetical protein Q9S71_07325 [Microbacterium sp. KSW4-11]|uniref:Uncharacterized protein n=1 Tax=Microbacterium gawkjiense TaxID=3067309 RepID=A0ABU3G9Y2_9MICO|nr:hypothetical protein [Microbacterium sp. KSW4-11]MDT3316633.1 hypothetical protein [Microbacterium sp. KSW4-11]
MSFRRVSVALALAAALGSAAAVGLTGCTAESAPPAETQEVSPQQTEAVEFAPATGTEVATDEYTFRLPDGWGFPDGAPDGFDPTTFAADLQDDDDYPDNVNILVSPGGEVTSDQVEQSGIDELEGAGATDVQTLDRVTAAGSESAHLTATVSTGEVPYVIDQYYLVDAGQTYIVTFSSSVDVPQEDRDALAMSVLATWQWV